MGYWIEITAIVFGPVIAVAITLWHQRRERYYQQRFDVFRSLVLSRRNNLSADFVNALNLIPVFFGQDRAVIEKRRQLMDLFNDGGWRSEDPNIRSRLFDRVEVVVAEMIRSIGQALNVRIDDIEILRGAYAPQGWADDEVMQRRARQGLIDVLEGKRAISVAPITPPTSEKLEPPRDS